MFQLDSYVFFDGANADTLNCFPQTPGRAARTLTWTSWRCLARAGMKPR